MQYFGEPKCPYCGKKVNLIRTWSLKRQGEYCCTHCGGISNVKHLPLLNVLALLCGLIAFAIYFFSRYVFNSVSLKTAVYILIQFLVFYVGSLFLVQLKQPVIRKGVRESEASAKERRSIAAGAPEKPKRQSFIDAMFDQNKNSHTSSPDPVRRNLTPQQQEQLRQNRLHVQQQRAARASENEPTRVMDTQELIRMAKEDSSTTKKIDLSHFER